MLAKYLQDGFARMSTEPATSRLPPHNRLSIAIEHAGSRALGMDVTMFTDTFLGYYESRSFIGPGPGDIAPRPF